MFSQRRSYYWLHPVQPAASLHSSTTQFVVVLLCCISLGHDNMKFISVSFFFKGVSAKQQKNKSQRKKKSLQHYRSKCIKWRLYGKYYKMFASKNDWSKWPARREFDRSNPQSGRTLSVDWPLFWALISTLTNILITLWFQQLLFISNDVWKTVSELRWRHNQDRKLKGSIDFKNLQSTQINWNLRN